MALRRRRGGGHDESRGLTAAARKINLKEKSRKLTPDKRQHDAWGYYSDVPELKELCLWRGNQMAKIRLFAAAHPQNNPDAEPVPAVDETSGIPAQWAEVAAELVRSLRSSVGGQAEVLRRMEVNLEVVGEAWVVEFGAKPGGEDPAEVIIASIREVTYKPGAGDKPGVWNIKRRPDDKKGRDLDATYDDIFRVWLPHAEWGDLADCATLGTLGVLELLQILQGQLKAEARSRVPAGLFTFPNELTIGPPVATTPEDGQEAPADRFLAAVIEAITNAVEDPSDVATLAPLFIRGPKDAMTPDVLRKIDLSRQSDEHLDKRIEGLIERLARGLDAPVEVIKGHMQTTFANADQVDTDTWEDYLEPRAVLVCDAFTVGYLRSKLLDAHCPPDIAQRIFVWYDASDLIAQPDPSEAADSGHDRYTISDKAWRRAKGYDDADAPDPVEVLWRVALKRGPLAPNVTNALLELLAPDVDLPDPQGSASTGIGFGDSGASRFPTDPRLAALTLLLGPQSRPVVAATGRSIEPHRPAGLEMGRRMVAIDRELRTRLLVASNDAMERALERAGNRLKSKARNGIRDTLRRVPAVECAARLGPTLLADAGFDPGELLDDAWDALESQFMAWGAQAQSDAMELVNRVVAGFSTAQRDQLGLRLADSLSEAWGWMKGALTSLAEARLFDPSPSAPALGEFDPSLRVPPGLVRQAVARAGGAAGLTTDGAGGAWVALVDGGTRPAGGIATGQILGDEMRDNGAGIEAWQWDYGPAQRSRPFEEHVALDGEVFADYSASSVANLSGWPPYSMYMPGDHDGCLCDSIPIIVYPDE